MNAPGLHSLSTLLQPQGIGFSGSEVASLTNWQYVEHRMDRQLGTVSNVPVMTMPVYADVQFGVGTVGPVGAGVGAAVGGAVAGDGGGADVKGGSVGAGVGAAVGGAVAGDGGGADVDGGSVGASVAAEVEGGSVGTCVGVCGPGGGFTQYWQKKPFLGAAQLASFQWAAPFPALISAELPIERHASGMPSHSWWLGSPS